MKSPVPIPGRSPDRLQHHGQQVDQHQGLGRSYNRFYRWSRTPQWGKSHRPAAAIPICSIKDRNQEKHPFKVGRFPTGNGKLTDRLSARELDEEKRKMIYGEFQQVVQEQVPMIFKVLEVAMMAVRDRVTGLKYSGLPSWGLWNIYEMKIDDN